MEAVYIVGAGGIGCVLGYTLLSAGVSTTFVEASPAKIAWGRSNGVAVDRRPSLPASFLSFEEWSCPTGAVVLLCTKCPANSAVLSRLPAETIVIPVQNGVDPALDARRPRIEGIASFVSECPLDRTVTQITRPGALHLGFRADTFPPPSPLQQLADRLCNALRQGPFRLHRVENISPYKYTKLLYNSAISPLAAAAGLDNGELLRRRNLRGLFFALLRENQAILQHAGITLARIGPFHPATVARILSRPWLAHLMAHVFYPSLKGTYCSMAPDLKGQLTTEIENYNGHLIHLAGRFPCPLNQAVRTLVKRMERDRLPPHPDHLLDLLTVEAGQESKAPKESHL